VRTWRAQNENSYGSDEDSLAEEILEWRHTNPGADVDVLGSYAPLPGKEERRIRLNVRLQDTEQGETICRAGFCRYLGCLTGEVAGGKALHGRSASPLGHSTLSTPEICLPRRSRAPALFISISYVLSVILTKERSLPFQPRQDAGDPSAAEHLTDWPEVPQAAPRSASSWSDSYPGGPDYL
jgi:hypothetical protein